MKAVVDASFVVKLFVEEPDSAAARELFQTVEAIAPDLILIEVWNAVWKRRRKGLLEDRQVTAIRESIARPFQRLTPVEELAQAAMALSLRLDHPVYDCLYLALAEREGAPIVSADRRLITLADAIGVMAHAL